MPAVSRFELLKVDLPFRRKFRHAAAERRTSESLFLKCTTNTGASGFGECLPRVYVTGETRDGAFELLQRKILPNLLGMTFGSLDDVYEFLADCDGKAPREWIMPSLPQSSAWCAVDLALLDAFGRAFDQRIHFSDRPFERDRIRYSAVVSADGLWRLGLTLAKLKLYGFAEIKLKISSGQNVNRTGRIARVIMGDRCVLRIDANMAWREAEAMENIHALARLGIRCIEQPLPADDLDGLARLVRETQAEIIADESFNDRASLEALVQKHACTGINVRISKCGGLTAAARRCEEAMGAGLAIQIGCHVGESSLLSAAQLILISAMVKPRYVEGCYGRYLLRRDPVRPCLQLGYGGRAPDWPTGNGLGVEMDETQLNRFVSQRVLIGDVAGGR